MSLSANPQFEVLFNSDLLAVLESAIELEQNMSSENDMSMTNIVVRAQQKVDQDSSLFKSNANALPQKLIDLELLTDVSTINLSRMRSRETILDESEAGYSIYDKGIAQQETAIISKLTTESVLNFLNNVKKLKQFKDLKDVETINALQEISQQLPEIIRGFANLIRSLIKSMTQLTDDELIALEKIRYNLLTNQRLIKQYFEESKTLWLSLAKPTNQDGLLDKAQYDMFINALVKSESSTLIGQVDRSTNQNADYKSKHEIIDQIDKISYALTSTTSIKSFSYMITNLDIIWTSIQQRIRAKREQKITTTDLIASINNLLDTFDKTTMLSRKISFSKASHDLHQNDRFEESDQSPIFIDNLSNLEKVICQPINRSYKKSTRISDESSSETVEPSLPDYMFLRQNIMPLVDEDNTLDISNNVVVPLFSIRDWIWSIQNEIIKTKLASDTYPETIFDERLQANIVISKIAKKPTDIIVLENRAMISEIGYEFTIKII